MAIKTYEAFKAPSPYEQERLRAERQRRYAELLEQQAMEPESEFTYQGIRAMPSPAAALGKLLSAYQGKKAREKAEEAEARKTGMEEEASRQIMNRLIGGRPVTDANTTPDEFGLAEIATEAKYTVSPELTAEAMRMAMTPQGVGAMRGNPMLAAALQQSMQAPKTEKFGTTPVKGKGGKYYLASESGRLVPTDVDVPEETLTPYQQQSLDLDRERLEFDRSRPATPKATESAEGLRKEFTGQTAPYRGVADAFVKIKNAAMNPSAANDLALIFSYMRALDPASTVREGEFATAQNAAGVDVQVRNLYNKIVSGERLSQPQRQDFLQSAYGMVESQVPNVQQVIDRYTGIANRSGLNPEDIVSNPLQALKIPRLQGNNDSQYKLLKSGDLYFSPDGVMRRKK
jgi:hypothetical protein